MIKFNELSKENQKYIKEKQILKQEINEKEQEINEKEQELENNKTKIIDLEYQNKLLKEELDDLKNKENNELKNKKAKIKKSYDNLSTSTKIPQSVRKKDDKIRTFAPKETETYKNIEEEEINYLPKYYEESDRLKKLINEYNYTTKKIYISEPITGSKKLIMNPIILRKKNIFEPITKSKKLNPKYIAQLIEDNKNELEISNAKLKYLDKMIKKNPEMSTKKIDMINQLKTLYTMRTNYFKVRSNDPKGSKADLKLLDDEIRKSEDKFRNQKGSSTFPYQNKFVKLLALLTQLLTKNNSKKLRDDINQILKELYNSKQITKQLYNILNNDS